MIGIYRIYAEMSSKARLRREEQIDHLHDPLGSSPACSYGGRDVSRATDGADSCGTYRHPRESQQPIRRPHLSNLFPRLQRGTSQRALQLQRYSGLFKLENRDYPMHPENFYLASPRARPLLFYQID